MYPYPELPVSAASVTKTQIVVLKDDVDGDAVGAHIESVTSHHNNQVSISSGPSLPGLDSQCSVGNFRAYFGTFHPETLEHIKNSPEVDFVEQDQIMLAQSIVSQENVPSYGIARISQQAITDLSTYWYDDSAGEGVTVYIIDTGINTEHVDFEGRAVWGFNSADSTDDDEAGHGTHVAATIGGAAHGVAKKASLIAVKVLGGGGSGTTSGVIKGIEWATADARAKKSARKSVANMSLGGGFSAALNKAVEASISSGICYAVAAGNDGTDVGNSSPASVKSAITVGATQKDDTKPDYSNFGPVVDVFAPGTNITSAWIGSKTATNTISGTSMATPHVAGLAAYLIGAEGISGPSQITARILKLATQGVVPQPGSRTTDILVYNGSGH